MIQTPFFFENVKCVVYELACPPGVNVVVSVQVQLAVLTAMIGKEEQSSDILAFGYSLNASW